MVIGHCKGNSIEIQSNFKFQGQKISITVESQLSGYLGMQECQDKVKCPDIYRKYYH